MRFAYLDESGLGNAKVEPFVVVAGIIVHADDQIKSLEQYLHDMACDYIHPQFRKIANFHATELFNGVKAFDKQVYPQELRWKILLELCEIPKKFNLPVVMGFVPRGKYKSTAFRSNWDNQKLTVGAQVLASTCCLIAVEKYMHQTNETEVAALIYENNNHARELIRASQRVLKDPNITAHFSDDVLGPQWTAHLPLTRIVESPLFSEKNESSILQVADAVAWSINRKLRNADKCDLFFEPIDEQLIVRARQFDSAS